MKKSLLLIVGAIGLASVASVKAGDLPDLSAYGTPVETTGPVHPAAPSNEPTNRHWPAHVCAEIQRVEKDVVSGMGPADRAMPRLGLLMLEGLHCGIDVSKKMDADQAALEAAHRKKDRDYDEILAAAQRAVSRPQEEPIIVQVPQDASEPAAPAPPRTLNCFTSRLGGGMSTTTCR
jgi:hypothetical protein